MPISGNWGCWLIAGQSVFMSLQGLWIVPGSRRGRAGRDEIGVHLLVIAAGMILGASIWVASPTGLDVAALMQ